jgi:uncharacterized OB-fold protein
LHSYSKQPTAHSFFQSSEKGGVLGYTTVNYKFKPLDNILAGKNIVLAEPDRILIKDSI